MPEGIDDLTLIMEGIRRKPRTLDGPPSKLQMSRVKDPTVFGYESNFKSRYNSIVGTVSTDEFCILLPNGSKITCDEQVYYLLRTLVISNVCYSIAYSQACTDLFTSIVLCGKQHITVQDVYSVVSQISKGQYEMDTLVKSVNDLLFKETGVIFEWHKIANCTQLYPNLRDAMCEYIRDAGLSTEKELHTLLKRAYKESRENEAFTKRLVAGIPNKEFIGALFLLHHNDDVMTVMRGDAGFMEEGD